MTCLRRARCDVAPARCVDRLAAQRLGQLRQADPRREVSLRVGGFGWIEHPSTAAPSPAPGEPAALRILRNAGFVQAPSAAGGNRRGPSERLPTGLAPLSARAPFAINIDSRRARLAVEILECARDSRSRPLLGYRFERALQEASRGRSHCAHPRAYPYHPTIATSGVPAGPIPGGAATDGGRRRQLTQFQAGSLSSQAWYVPVVGGAAGSTKPPTPWPTRRWLTSL